MKKKLMITLNEEIHKKLFSAAPPFFRSLFVEAILEDFFEKYSVEEIKENVFADFDRKHVRERLKKMAYCNINKNLDRINSKSNEISEKNAPEIEKEIDEMW